MMTMTAEDTSVSIGGTNCCLHTWNASLEKPKGLVLIFHGFTAHGLYPTVRYAATRLSAANYLVVAPDLPGHGKSDGLKGYISSATALVDAGVEIAQHVLNQHKLKLPDEKLFLLGSSMGGTICLEVSQKLAQVSSAGGKTTPVKGVILLAPMLMVSVGSSARYLLQGLSLLPGINTLPLIPSSSTSLQKQYRDATKRKECDEDTFKYSGNLRIAAASACVEMAEHIQTSFASINAPFLLLVADEDVVVNNQGSFDLMEQSPSTDKTMKRYPALHGLLCEPKPLVDQIENDMMEWIDARA